MWPLSSRRRPGDGVRPCGQKEESTGSAECSQSPPHAPWPRWSILPTCQGPCPCGAFTIAVPAPFINSTFLLADEKSLPQKGFPWLLTGRLTLCHILLLYLLHSIAEAGALLLDVILFIVCLLLLECKLQEIKDFVLLVHCHILGVQDSACLAHGIWWKINQLKGWKKRKKKFPSSRIQLRGHRKSGGRWTS